MTYIKRAAELRLEGDGPVQGRARRRRPIGTGSPASRRSTSCPATRLSSTTSPQCGPRSPNGSAGVSGVRDEKYRLYFDGIMNWNKLGLLSREVRRAWRRGALRPVHPQCVLAGAAAHRRGRSDPRDGPALPALPDQPRHEDPGLPDAAGIAASTTIDGVVFHSTRTCRAFTGPQRLLAKTVQRQARHTDDVLRRRRRRRLLLQGRDPGEPSGGDAGGDRRPPRPGEVWRPMS